MTVLRRKDHLRGLVVLDLSRLLPGPYASMRLADLGATVIRLDDPVNAANYSSRLGSFGETARQMDRLLGRSKKSLALDLRHPRGQDVVRRLVPRIDVFLEGYRPGVLEKGGLGPSALLALNPRLIYCSLTGYGQVSSHAQLAGHDLNYTSTAGVLDLVGRREGAPVIPGVQIADLAGGMAASEAICAALVGRGITGKGCHLDIAMVDAAFSWLALNRSLAAAGEETARGRSVVTGAVVSYHVYAAADGGHVALAALEEKFWSRFCDAVERPEWKGRGLERIDQPGGIHAELERLFRTRSARAWDDIGRRVDCCLTAVQSFAEVLSSDLAISRNVAVEEGRAGLNSGHLSPGGAGGEVTPAPSPGEHSREVLRGFDFTDAEVDSLLAERVVAQA
jgi:alpha-methylacyl-CoA racemase